MKRHERKLRLVVLVAALSMILVGGIERIYADALFWNELSGGDYETQAFWTPSSPVGGPTLSDNAMFDLPDSYTVTFNSSPTNNALFD